MLDRTHAHTRRLWQVESCWPIPLSVGGTHSTHFFKIFFYHKPSRTRQRVKTMSPCLSLGERVIWCCLNKKQTGGAERKEGNVKSYCGTGGTGGWRGMKSIELLGEKSAGWVKAAPKGLAFTQRTERVKIRNGICRRDSRANGITHNVVSKSLGATGTNTHPLGRRRARGGGDRGVTTWPDVHIMSKKKKNMVITDSVTCRRRRRRSDCAVS